LERDEDLSAVSPAWAAHEHAALDEPVDQLDGAVVAQL
jgi:hypothetical protein